MISSVFTGVSAVDAEAAAEWRSSLYPENWTPGYTNSSGQFLHDFSYAGYEKGEKAIPETMAGLFANVLDYGADNTGSADATSAIQSAIDAVQAAGGGTVYLPAGTYKVKPSSNSNASALRITGSNILFKGDGEGKTFIRCYAENMRYCQVINVSPSGGTWDSADDGNYYYLSQDISNTPTTTIHLNSVGNLAVGDWVIIRSDRTQAWIDEHDMGGFWYASVNPATMGTTFYRQITAVNTGNNTIEIDIPTRYYMKTRDNARVYKVAPKQSNVGLCDFSIGNKANSNTSGWGEEDYKTSGNGAYNVNNAFLIKFGMNINCFAKNISTYSAGNTNGYHMSSNGLDISRTRSLTIDNCDFSHPQYEGGGGNGYGMNICGQETLIKDCSSTSARHSYSFKYSYANGNVIYHYTSTDPKYGSDFHMYLSMSNLIDNQELNGDFIESNVRPYGGTAGNRHGYTSTQTVFWNTKGNYYKSGSSHIIDSRQYGYGYIIGTQGAATAVKTTSTTMSSTYGTVNTAPEDYKEGIGSGSTLYPQSLYYDQLERRLGGTEAEPVVTSIPGTIPVNSYSDKTTGITISSENGVTYAGDLHTGSYLDYQIQAAQAGDYTVTLQLAAGDAQYNASNMVIKVNDVTAATVPVTASASWTSFVSHTANIRLENAGTYKLTIEAQDGACNVADILVSKTETDTPKEDEDTTVESGKYGNGFKAVAYYPNWYGDFTSSVQWDKLTHVNYSFALPNAGGTVDSVAGSAGVINSLIAAAHANDVKVNLAVGGWSYSDGSLCAAVFEQATNTDAKCQSLANSILALVDQYGFDGVDIDWEYPTSSSAAQFTAFMRYLRTGLTARGKLLTSAVQATGGTYQTDEVLDMVDWINVMAYDGNSGSGHSPYSLMVNAFQYWNGTRGVPAEKVVLGVPFYERPNWASYADIVSADAANAYKDSAVINGTTVYYNGLTTMAEKATYAAQNAGGIMIWEISQDSKNEDLSLLNAIYDAAVAVVGTDTQVTVTKIPGTIPVNSYSDKTSSVTMESADGIIYAGNLHTGSYLDYQIEVPVPGDYTVTLRLAAGEAQYNAENMLIQINDAAAATVPIKASDSWTNFIEHTAVISFANAGTYTLSLVSEGGACNVADITVSSDNLALGRNVTASGSENEDTAPEKAVDGEAGTRWSSNYADNAWISVDLGGTYAVNKVLLNWEAAYGTAYQIQVSEDGSSWTTVKSLTGQDGGIDIITFDAVNARYVKMQGAARAMEYGYSLWEMEVYGTEAMEEPAEPSTEESSEASSEESSESSKDNESVTGSDDYVYNAASGTVTFTLNNSSADAILYLATFGSESAASSAYNSAMAALPGIALEGHGGYIMSSANGVHTYSAAMAPGTWFVYGFNALSTTGFETWKIGVAQAASPEVPTETPEESSSESEEESQNPVITPAKVTGLKAVYENGQIRLTWDNNGAVKYRVMRFDGINDGYTTLTYSASAEGYADKDLIDVHRYFYRVCGYFYDAEGKLVQGGVSDSVGIVATDRDPAKVENVNASVSGQNVTLTWDRPEGVRYYKIARAYGATPAEGSYACLKYNVEETTYTDAKVSAGTWRYKVVGYYKAVDGGWVYGDMSTTLFVTVK